MQEEIKVRLNLIAQLFSFPLQFKYLKLQIKPVILSVFYMGVKLGIPDRENRGWERSRIGR
jgi:hypothetical protein